MSKPSPYGPTAQAMAESKYRARWQELWRAAQVAEVPAVLIALQRFHAAAIALSLSRGRTPKRGEPG
jgi:hypothetical protein